MRLIAIKNFNRWPPLIYIYIYIVIVFVLLLLQLYVIAIMSIANQKAGDSEIT